MVVCAKPQTCPCGDKYHPPVPCYNCAICWVVRPLVMMERRKNTNARLEEQDRKLHGKPWPSYRAWANNDLCVAAKEFLEHEKQKVKS